MTTTKHITRRRIASIYDIPDEMMDEPVKVLEQDIESEVRTLTITLSVDTIRRGADSEGLDLFIARKHQRFIERLEAVGYIISEEPEAETIETLSGETTVILRVTCSPGGVTEVDKQVREDCDPAVDHRKYLQAPWDGLYD